MPRFLPLLAAGLLSACGGASPPPARTEASLVVHVPCVTPPCAGEAPPEPPPITEGRSPVTMLALGRAHSCALTEDGVVHCWGDNSRGQLGDVGLREADVPAPVPSLPPMAAVWAGFDSTCARTSDDARLFCWGNTGLGDSGRDGPVQALPFRGVRYVSLADRLGCFLNEDAELYCWGDYGRPHGPVWELPERVRVPGARSVAIGSIRGCAVGADGRLACWGQRAMRLEIERRRETDGLWTYRELHEAAQVAFTEGVQAYPLVLSEQGRLYQVELGEEYDHGHHRHIARRVYDVDEVVQLSAGFNHHCVRTSAGVGFCWGNNRRGQVGDGTNASARDEPRRLELPDIQEIASGSNHACATTPEGVFCWGDNRSGQLGLPDVREARTPTPLAW